MTLKLALISTARIDGPRATSIDLQGMDTWGTSIDAFTDYLSAGGRTPRTIRLRRYWLQRLATDHPNRSPWTLSPLELTGWLGGGPWSPETRKSIRASIRALYDWGAAMGITDANPARALPPVRVPRRIPRPTPDDVTAHALAAAQGRDLLMLRLALHAGLRREEIAALPWSALDGTWLAITGKGGHQRRVPIPVDLAAMLLEEARRRRAGELGPGWRFRVDPASPYIFPGLRGGHMHVDSVGSTLSRLLGEAWTGHTLRHRYATRALRGSRNLRATQELLGHASILTTQGYTLIVDDDLVEAAQWAA